jgi:3-hydroxybutyryl-CoA dehydrogenase
MQSSEIVESPVYVAVIGLGLMGRSIVACLLAAGHRVIGITNDLAASAETPTRVKEMVAQMHSEGLLHANAEFVMDRFLMSDAVQDIASCSIVFESVTEDVALKRDIVQQFESVIADTAIFATNTSAIPVSELQEGTKHPERILGIHWHEPAHVSRFMEIIPGKATQAEYVARIVALAPSWGKEPSVLKREIRGFISNRISYAMFREACHLVDSGVCGVEDVDHAMRNDVGWWMAFAGPFRYMDLMGVEAYYRVMKDLLPDLVTSPDVPKLIREVVEDGGRGISNGRGFYRYTAAETEAWEARYAAFNYKMRQLTMEYSHDLAKRSAEEGTSE